MFQTNKRVVVVPIDFYVQLNEYLLPEERWYDPEDHGMVLFCQDFSDGDSKQLIFTTKERYAEKQKEKETSSKGEAPQGQGSSH